MRKDSNYIKKSHNCPTVLRFHCLMRRSSQRLKPRADEIQKAAIFPFIFEMSQKNFELFQKLNLTIWREEARKEFQEFFDVKRRRRREKKKRRKRRRRRKK